MSPIVYFFSEDNSLSLKAGGSSKKVGALEKSWKEQQRPGRERVGAKLGSCRRKLDKHLNAKHSFSGNLGIKLKPSTKT